MLNKDYYYYYYNISIKVNKIFWIIKTKTWAAWTDIYSSESIRFFRTIMRTYVFRDSKASYKCKDPGTISPRCSREKSLTVLKSVGFSCKALIASIIQNVI